MDEIREISDYISEHGDIEAAAHYLVLKKVIRNLKNQRIRDIYLNELELIASHTTLTILEPYLS